MPPTDACVHKGGQINNVQLITGLRIGFRVDVNGEVKLL